jgi:hypothetical protein
MPSTYSNLKIQLMATGENNTTWGNVTNDNLGVAIEEAIVGSADVTFSSGDVTLTLTNTNATQTARNMRLRCTGTTGGARNLIVPAIEKPYIVQNDCADAITVKNTTGTGIAVPAGKTMWVYNDGTNVVAVTTHLTSLTLGTALPVASGGTGVTTSTGSNNNVLSDAPTIVNPTSSNGTFTTPNITNPTVTNYVETLFAPAAGSSFTVTLSNGTVQRFTTNANTTITLPASVAGKSFVIMVQYGGTHTLTWAGGSTLKWNANVTPTPTSANGKIDIFSFFQDGTNTYGSTFGQNF